MKTKNKTRIMWENFSILLMFAVSIMVLVFSFIHIDGLEQAVYSTLLMGRIAERIFAVILMVVSYNLYKRKRAAWMISVSLLVLNIVFHIFQRNHWIVNVFIFCELLILVVFIWGKRDFYKASDHLSAVKGISIGAAAICAVGLNAALGYWFYAKTMIEGYVPSPITCLYIGINNIFGRHMEVLYNGQTYPMLLQRFTFWFSWICILIAVFFIVKPFLGKKKTTKEDLQKARKLVNAYGQNPSAYLTLEDDKTLFFGKTVEGVVPYGTVGDTVIINGDPICAPENFEALLQEFHDFCTNASYNMFYLSVTDKYLDYYKKMDYAVVKCGEEARFDLATYDIKGKKGAKMRANINKATRAGITVKEYKVSEKREPLIDAEFDRISSEWLDGKSSSQLAFTLGGVGLENPMDKRYFYGYDENGIMQGFIVFCPFEDGYMADVTRRGKDAPGGIMQKIMFEAFQVFKEEGAKWGSMGLAPLANLTDEEGQNSGAEKLLAFIYENLNNIYGFKNLYRAKQAYSPSSWEPGYFVYSPKLLTPQMVYAVVAIQNPQGIGDYVKAFFKGAQKNRKKQAEETAKHVAEEQLKKQEKTTGQKSAVEEQN